MRVFLTGGSGFVGSNLVPVLLRNGHKVRALVHRQSTHSAAQASSDNLEEVRGDICADLTDLVSGCDAVINLVGIIYERGRATFEEIHHRGTKNLIEAAYKNRVRRFVQISALGARPTTATRYHTTKFAAEEEVRNSGIASVVLRPSLIVGSGSAFVQQMIGVMQAAPFVRPVAGTGKYRFRPVDVTDVVECFVQSLTNSAATAQTVDLVGGEELSLDEIGEAIAARLRVHKSVVHIPLPVMKMVAALLSMLPVEPPFTSVQLRMLEEGSTADPAPMKRIFNIEPMGFRAGLQRYLTPQSIA